MLVQRLSRPADRTSVAAQRPFPARREPAYWRGWLWPGLDRLIADDWLLLAL